VLKNLQQVSIVFSAKTRDLRGRHPLQSEQSDSQSMTSFSNKAGA